MTLGRLSSVGSVKGCEDGPASGDPCAVPRAVIAISPGKLPSGGNGVSIGGAGGSGNFVFEAFLGGLAIGDPVVYMGKGRVRSLLRGRLITDCAGTMVGKKSLEGAVYMYSTSRKCFWMLRSPAGRAVRKFE